MEQRPGPYRKKKLNAKIDFWKRSAWRSRSEKIEKPKLK